MLGFLFSSCGIDGFLRTYKSSWVKWDIEWDDVRQDTAEILQKYLESTRKHDHTKMVLNIVAKDIAVPKHGLCGRQKNILIGYESGIKCHQVTDYI